MAETDGLDEVLASVRELQAGLAFGLPDDVPQSTVRDAIATAVRAHYAEQTAALERVRALHSGHHTSVLYVDGTKFATDRCPACNQPVPCPTREALTKET